MTGKILTSNIEAGRGFAMDFDARGGHGAVTFIFETLVAIILDLSSASM